ncbi:MAG TPA: glycosyltransferase [Candidatus Eisenbacteria bacterium]|nr:glycosyltransferase [Candidatus Eisenbacteria bacterium]
MNVRRNGEIFISIVIATRGRSSLAQLLESLCRLDARDTIAHEILIANNSADEAGARGVDEVVLPFIRREPSRFRLIRIKTPGKSLAINTAIGVAAGNITAFLDDDVAVERGWLLAVADFFQNSQFAAMQGTILLPPGSEHDVRLQQLYNRYRTICLFPLRDSIEEIETLTGANMAVRRDLFDAVGLFDIRLGPGQSGTSDDTELAERILRSGARIGCAPGAVVYHEVDWSRLTEDYFRYRHEQQGRSRFIYKNPSMLTILADLAHSIVDFLWHFIRNEERKKYRAKGRYYHYRAMLREKLATARRGTQTHASTAHRQEPVPY